MRFQAGIKLFLSSPVRFFHSSLVLSKFDTANQPAPTLVTHRWKSLPNCPEWLYTSFKCLWYEISKDGWFFKQKTLLADHYVAKGVFVFFNFLVRIPVHVSQSCSCTHLVSAYIVALFQCFRMVPVHAGGTKMCQQKTATLSHEVRLNHP